MAIFGIDSPKIVFSSGAEIILDFANIVKDEPDYDIVEHKSKLSGDRLFTAKGMHWTFEVTLNVFKYPGGNPGSEQVYQDLAAQLYQDVTLYRHKDGDAIKDASGVVVPFTIVEVTPFYLERAEYRDTVLIKFKSKKYVDFTKSVTNQGIFLDFERNLNGGTFSRTGTAYVLNPDSGLLESVADGIPRYVAGKFGGRAILLDGSRTNIITHPSAFDNAAWTKDGGVTISANTTETKDPAGANNADKISTLDLDRGVAFATTLAIGTSSAAFSVWLKSTAGSINIDLYISSTTGGTLTQTTVVVTPTWQRFKISYTNASPVGNWWFKIKTPDGTENFYAYGATAEKGSNVLFSSHSIDPLATATASTGVELLEYLIANNINESKGTVWFWFKPEWNAASQAGSFLFYVKSTNSAGRAISYFINSSGNHELRYYDQAGSVASSINTSATSVYVQDTWVHVAFTYDAALQEAKFNLRLYINGVSVATDGLGKFIPAQLATNFYLGSSSIVNQAFGAFDRFGTSSKVLSASQILDLTKESI